MPLLTSDTDTIAAIGTPRGEGGIGIVRLSGENSLSILRRLFHPSRRKSAKSHVLTHGHIRHPETGDTVDEVLAVYYRSPRTYTGEEMVEIHAHGGQLVLMTLLELVCGQGARVANPGEFTQRAFLNGRLDLAQSEAVMDIIHAKTAGSLRAAAAQLTGALSGEVRRIRDNLISVLAEIEARVDFPEEDLDFEPSDALLAKTDAAAEAIRRLLERADEGRLLRDGVQVVIVGKPNVGKSSLLNALLREERAIVTEIPGTTRDLIEEHLNIGGIPMRLTDTAGIRETADPVEREGVARTRRKAESADLLVVLLDISRPLEPDDLALLERAPAGRTVVAINKCDLSPVWEEAEIATSAPTETPFVRLSIRNAFGLDTLANELARLALGSDSLGADPPLVTNLRHQEALRDAQTALSHARETLLSGLPPELAAVDLRGSLYALGFIVGETVTDDILDRIFSQFCIGK